MAHSDNPDFNENDYDTIDEWAKTILDEGGTIDYVFESDSQPVSIDDAQHAIVDADGNKWLVRKVIIHLQPAAVK
ncbi:MAG TPA: hypothetical protein PK109_01615 [Candidatus Paceibacterota bacterium]|nr:hypothetical protein [Candidatus Paceibacterota bacterium]